MLGRNDEDQKAIEAYWAEESRGGDHSDLIEDVVFPSDDDEDDKDEGNRNYPSGRRVDQKEDPNGGEQWTTAEDGNRQALYYPSQVDLDYRADDTDDELYPDAGWDDHDVEEGD